MFATRRVPFIFLFTFVLLIGSLNQPLLGQNRPTDAKSDKDSTKTPKKPKTFHEIITDSAQSMMGIVNVHTVDDKRYFEIPESLFGRDIMTVTRMSKTPTGAGYGGEQANRQVIQYSDLIGLSIYPYLFGEIGLRGEANPADTLPADWLSRWAMLDPSKPFAITETAYIAQDLKMDTFGIEITGSEQHQAAYVQRLLNEAARLNAEFVIWFIMRDYDQFVTTIESFGIPSEAFLIWRDTGLINEAGQGRPAFEIWQDWLALPLVIGTNQAHSDS